MQSLLFNSNLSRLFQLYWHEYFKKPLDELPPEFHYAREIIRDYFFQCQWFEVYDFVEFTAQSVNDNLESDFVNFCNYVLEREMSAYRLISKRIVEITSEEEILSIETALENTEELKGAREHLETALDLLSDRKSPDFRNSIKESISSVEALAKILTGNEKTTLGDALKALERSNKIHPALKSSLSSLYGYTSDAHGIRHAMLDETNLTFNDAKFMLVSCTAFINYLIGKAIKEGIKLN